MIGNLNKQAFGAFGSILRDSLPNRGFPKGDEWYETVRYFSSKELFFYRCEEAVYLDFEYGMTVLVIRNEGHICSFYLDKPICIHANIVFSIVPYQEECSVRLSMPKLSQLQQLDRLESIEDLKIHDRFLLGSIYTLFYHEEESGFLFKGEKHSTYELTYVDRGQLHCVVDGTGYVLKQGQMMLFAPDQWHMQYTDLDVTARFLTISFDLICSPEVRFSDRVIDLSSTEASFLKQLLLEIDIDDPLSYDFIRCYLKMLLLTVIRDAHGRKKRLKTPVAIRNENTIVSRALQYIADHVYDRLSVESVAKGTGVSASHLTALFHRQMNISPGEYIRRVKLEESKVLIREGRMNFSQIAAALNYSTIHHFSRQFKDNFGISPTEYAKSIHAE
ncbi:MAG: AraC family transcriptional regulator [Ruminococcaceae bacterium]|nr:AraC family transcriptional regulator [Oscillospiraceae bacterium]